MAGVVGAPSVSLLAPRRRSTNLHRRANAEEDRGPGPLAADEEDARYISKLALGCTAGAIVVKYGSLVVPSLTTPNLPQALAMVSAPVALSVALLLIASTSKKDSPD